PRQQVPPQPQRQPPPRLPQKTLRPNCKKLKGLLDGGLISADDYEKAKAEVLKQLIN
ncbi:hypothetical protein NEIELOOT_02070, partial [Neisseria elongata subsp. glycolytica ATCC 29315]